MNINAKVSIAIRNFFKKYGKFILIIFVCWLIVFIINQQLKKIPKEVKLINTYQPDTAVIDDGGNVPKKYVSDVRGVVEKYFTYCNYKEYENAYNLLTTECRTYLYGDDISLFADYVDSIFTTKKIYSLQSYSNVGDTYIYDMIITDDIEATGTTGTYEPYREKIAVRKVADEFMISNQGFMDSQKYNIVSEDENLRVEIASKDMSYKKEGYNVTITNKTDSYIVILDNTLKNEITLNLGDQKRGASNFSNASLVLNPGQTRKEVFIFDKFYDDGKDPTEISLENVRIMETYSTTMENTYEDADRMYSFNIPLKK